MTAGVPEREGLSERDRLSDLARAESPERAGARSPERAGAGSPEPSVAGLRARVRAVAEFGRGSEDRRSASSAFSGERRCSSDMTWTS